MNRHFILGTAGHIDHGKSTLVKALTGSDPDRLPEEQQRGMTIELGFAHFEIDDPGLPEMSYRLGVVDVPGHADFVRNMVAGVASLDVALFVVAADDGWMPQSEEHLQILAYLGITRAVIALTKADLADDIDFAGEMLREDVRGTWLEAAPIVPVSVPAGRGLDDLRAALAAVLRDAPGPPDIGKPRLHVDRAFTLTGIGTVVTGTLTGGALAAGTAAIVQPRGLPSHVRTVQSHRSPRDHARPGMRTALNLADVPLATREKKAGVSRGDVVTLPRLGAPGATVDVVLEKSPRPVAGQPGFTRPLRHGQRVQVHHGSATHSARVYFLGTKALGPGASALAELRFDSPVHAFAGDRFVLRDSAKRHTIAGGVILDPDAKRAEFRRSRQRAFLEARAMALDQAEPSLVALLARDRAVARDGLLTKTRFSEAEVRTAVEALTKSRHLVAEGGWLLEAEWWTAVTTEAAAFVESYHREHPDTSGLSLSLLRAEIGSRLPEPRLFDLLVTRLTRHGFSRDGDTLKAGGHQAVLPPHLRQSGERILAALAATPLDPPNPKELAPTPDDQRALRFLIQNHDVVELDEKAVLSRAAYEALRTTVIDTVRTLGQATAAELRDATRTTRRFLIPLLERLDREGVTRRQGDYRRLK